jgi:hypothetical protein
MKTRVTATIFFYGFVNTFAEIYDTTIVSNSIADFEKKKKNWLEEKKAEVIENETTCPLGRKAVVHALEYEDLPE